MRELIDKLYSEHSLSREEYLRLITRADAQLSEYLFEKAREVRKAVYGNDVYIRGLIEFTNYCKNDCLYCGIRRSNKNAERYRLTEDDIWPLEYEKHGAPDSFIPMGAVVTAFGTGAEMNNGAVITNEDKMQKSPLWGAFYSFAILDPVYTMTMPMQQVISGAFDSLSHSMETYMGSPRAVNYSDEINEATQRNIIRNIRKTLEDPHDAEARSELVWAAAMAENGMLKIGKTTDFQCHMLEHQLGAYTDCNHGQGLAVIHPALYRHMLPEATGQFARMATEVWGVSPEGKSEAELAKAFVDALAAFIREIGLPTTFSEMKISSDTDFKAIADSTILTGGCAKRFTKEELLEVLLECR